MKVPFLDIARENADLEPELLLAAARVIRSGRVLFGPELEAFEHELAAWHGVKHAVGLASGTDAVEVALRATGGDHKPDATYADALHVSAFTAVPTINAMEAAGVTPVLVDPDPVTRNAKAGLAVHLFGLATDARGAHVEDVAHSMGAICNGKIAGTMAAAGALSFYPTKILGALGDGGAVITNDDRVAARARKIRHYGFEESGDVATRGQNSRLSEMQAAFLRVKLPRVRGWIDRRREIAARYSAELAGRVVVPAEPPGCRAVYHVYCAEHPDRDRIKAGLAELGVGAMVHYAKAIHQYSRWWHLGATEEFPVAERLAATVLSLPMYPYLRDDEQDMVIAAVKEWT